MNSKKFEISEESAASLYDLTELVARQAGIDWDELSVEKQLEIFQQFAQHLGNYFQKTIQNLDDPELEKHVRMLTASGFDPKLAAKYPEVTSLFEISLQTFITQLNT